MLSSEGSVGSYFFQKKQKKKERKQHHNVCPESCRKLLFDYFEISLCGPFKKSKQISDLLHQSRSFGAAVENRNSLDALV
jgi:hypothetical protein